MAGIFYLNCLGVPELRAPDGRVIKFRVRKHLALLVYVAVDRRTQQSRDELAHLLWSGTPMREARHSLATAISTLRRVFGPSIVDGSRDMLRFRRDDLLLDLDRMEAGDLFPTDTLPAVEVDGFLAQFEVRDAQEFMLWRDRQQARWLPHIHQALIRLIEHHRRAGASRAVGGLADRLLAIDPLAEAGVRAKMEALAFAGDRIAALRVFEEYREQLHRELQAVPPPLIEGMARRLRRRGVERPAADPVPSVPTDPWRDRPFVGREEEYRHLYEAWEATANHGPRHALVEGESGIGKSTLVERFAMAAALEGAVVGRAQCYELEQALPFATIATLITALHDKPGVAATDPARLAEVARVVPGIRGRFPHLPEAMAAQGETARLHFAEGVLAMLEAAMEEQPVVLVVDDFHLADEVSLTVLHLLMRRIEAGRFMVLLTLRTSEVLRSAGATRIRDGTGYLRMSRLLLPPLTDEECTALVQALTSPGVEPPTAAERQLILHAARGIPMVIQLLMQDWGRHGSVGLSIVSRSMTERVEGTATQESAYAHILERVIGDLDPVTLLVLHTASVLGSRLNDIGMYQVAELSISQVMMGLAGLAGRHVLRDSPAGLDFVNDLVRAQAYVGMPLPLRRTLHGAVADRLLARQDAAQETARGLEMAWHLVRGGRAAEAAPHLLRGGREAIQEGAPHEAELALKSALHSSTFLVGNSRLEAILLHAEVQQELSMWIASLETIGHLPAQLSQGHSEKAQLFTIIAKHQLRQYEGVALVGAVETLLAMLEDACDEFVRSRAASTAARISEELQSSAFHARITAGLARLEPLCVLPESQAHVLLARATVNYHKRLVNEGIIEIHQAIAILQSNNITSSDYVNLVQGSSALYCAIGEYDKGLAQAKEAYRLARRLDNTYLARKAASNMAVCYGRLGMYAEQERWARTCLSHTPAGGHTHVFIRAALYIATSRAMTNESDTMSVYRDVIRQAAPVTELWEHQAILLDEADVLTLVGKRELALRLGRTGTSGKYEKLHSVGWAGKFARWVVFCALDEGAPRDARTRLGPLIGNLDRFDAIDRVEIVCAYLQAVGVNSEPENVLQDQARRTLASLPEATADQLARLGVLTPLGWTPSAYD